MNEFIKACSLLKVRFSKTTKQLQHAKTFMRNTGRMLQDLRPSERNWQLHY